MKVVGRETTEDTGLTPNVRHDVPLLASDDAVQGDGGVVRVQLSDGGDASGKPSAGQKVRVLEASKDGSGLLMGVVVFHLPVGVKR